MKHIVLFVLITYSAAAQTFTSSNLPIVIIDTHGQEIKDDPKIEADMGIIDNGPGIRNSLTDSFNGYNGKIGIEFRGSSSQMFPKKPYGLELINEEGEGVSASLLGMPEEEDWVLIATYNDKSLIRDALAYHVSRSMGRYASRTRFCEVVINGEYQGIYMMGEKIKRDSERVDISKLDPDEISGSNLTGGYILKIDKSTGDSGFGFSSTFVPPNRSADQYIYYQYEYPKYDEIANEQKSYIQSIIKSMETALSGITVITLEEQYDDYIDIDSFIDFFIANELSKNVDGYRLSTFFHKKKDQTPIIMGPVWDFNLGYGNADYCAGGPFTGWAYNFNYVCNGDWWLVPFWWEKLLTNYDFGKRLVNRWESLRAGELSTANLHQHIDSLAALLNAEAVDRNFEKWPVLGEYVWPNYYIGDTYEEEVTWLKMWVRNRAEWLDVYMPKIVTEIAPEFNIMETLSVFPNPTDGKFNIEYTVNAPAEVSIQIMDALGRQVLTLENGQMSSGTYVSPIEIQVDRGVLFICLTENGFQKNIKKIVVAR